MGQGGDRKTLIAAHHQEPSAIKNDQPTVAGG